MEPEVAEAAPAPEVYVPEMPEIKLFGKWSLDEIQINDTSLMDYIAVSKTHSRYLPHSAGRFGAKRFGKAACPIIERIVNSLMMHGRNNGKKLLAVRIVKHCLEIIYLLTGENPGQVAFKNIKTISECLADELINAAKGSSNSYAIKK